MHKAIPQGMSADVCTLPAAPARLEVRGFYWAWVVEVCPVWGCSIGRHVHGGGPLYEDPRDMLGHRAHLGLRGGYVLTDPESKRTAELIADVQERAGVVQ